MTKTRNIKKYVKNSIEQRRYSSIARKGVGDSALTKMILEGGTGTLSVPHNMPGA